MRKINAKKIFYVEGIKNLLKRNYKIEKDVIDVFSEVDTTLSFSENLNIIKSKYQLNTIPINYGF